MDEPWRHYAKWLKPVEKVQILYDSTHEVLGVSNTKTDSRMIFNKSWQGAQGVIVLMDTEFQFGKMRKALETDGGGGWATMRIYLIPLNYIL